jgi:hypothetical protein
VRLAAQARRLIEAEFNSHHNAALLRQIIQSTDRSEEMTSGEPC